MATLPTLLPNAAPTYRDNPGWGANAFTTLTVMDDGNLLSSSSNAHAGAVIAFPITDMPADFLSMDNLTYTTRWRTQLVGDDTITYGIRIVSGSTILAAGDSGGSFTSVTPNAHLTNTLTTTSNTHGYVNTTASKALWDAATVELRYTNTTSMGSDGNWLLVDYVGFTGNYTQTTTVPAAITNLSATPLANKNVTLNWTAPYNGQSAITSYDYRFKLTSSGTWGSWTTTGSTTNSYTVTGLLAGTQYDFQVRAVNAIGNAPDSNTATTTTLGVRTHSVDAVLWASIPEIIFDMDDPAGAVGPGPRYATVRARAGVELALTMGVTPNSTVTSTGPIQTFTATQTSYSRLYVESVTGSVANPTTIRIRRTSDFVEMCSFPSVTSNGSVSLSPNSAMTLSVGVSYYLSFENASGVTVSRDSTNVYSGGTAGNNIFDPVTGDIVAALYSITSTQAVMTSNIYEGATLKQTFKDTLTTSFANYNHELVGYGSDFRLRENIGSGTLSGAIVHDVAFKPDGTKAYLLVTGVGGGVTRELKQYSLSTPWDLSTATYDSVLKSLTNYESGIHFSSDGTRLFVSTYATTTMVQQYNTATPWSIAGLGAAGDDYRIMYGGHVTSGQAWDIQLSSDGLNLYATVAGPSSDLLLQYSLSTAWSLLGATFLQSFNIGAQSTVPKSFHFDDEGRYAYMVGGSSGGAGTLYMYEAGTNWDISTLTLVESISSPQSWNLGTDGNKVKFNPDSSRVYFVSGGATDGYYDQWDMPEGISNWNDVRIGISGVADNSAATIDVSWTELLLPGTLFTGVEHDVDASLSARNTKTHSVDANLLKTRILKPIRDEPGGSGWGIAPRWLALRENDNNVVTGGRTSQRYIKFGSHGTPIVDGPVKVHFAIKNNTGLGTNAFLRIFIDSTVIAQQSSISTTETAYTLTISDANKALITDYGNIVVSFYLGEAINNSISADLEYLWLEVPEAPSRYLDHNVDALLQKRVNRTHNVDARLTQIQILNVGHSVDSIISNVVSRTHSVDTIFRAERSLVYTVDASIAARRSHAHGVDVFISGLVRLRPISDVSMGLWTLSPLWPKVDDDDDTSDFIQSESGGLNLPTSTASLRLTPSGTPVSRTNHTLVFTCNLGGVGTSSSPARIWVELIQISSSTVIRTSEFGFSTDWIARTVTLTQPEMDSIADYSDLGVRFYGHSLQGYNAQVGSVYFQMPSSATNVVYHTHNVDTTIIEPTKTQTHQVDAVLKAVRTTTHSVDTQISAIRNINHSVDVLLTKVISSTHSVDASLLLTRTQVHDTDALLSATTSVGHAVDSLLQKTSTQTHSVDATFRLTRAVSYSVDAALLDVITNTHSVDAILSLTSEKVHSSDAVLLDTFTVSQVVDALAMKTVGLSFSADAVLRDTSTVEGSVDAWLSSRNSITSAVDAQIQPLPRFTGAASGSGTYSVTVNITPVENELMVAQVACRATQEVIVVPTGWTFIRMDVTADLNTTGLRQYAYYKVAGASEPGTYTWEFGDI